ncbi:unnamed protein product [Psylliodes chrysocephalus]|uniref:Double jelly roll-like domain-containing protein n=1 Tax=Psylliodes chrysocephalus TaxID=3402493 RepID=A0A9P0G6A1_9CUCU|nr:unnamed protein product [Psylliodes chrysocephala]
MDILNVTTHPFNDTSIEECQFHNYQPFIPGKLNYNDEIRIPIQELDSYTLPSQSFLYIEGKLLTDSGNVPTKLKFINNAIAFLFRELRYELNGVVIDSVRDLGLTSTIKNYLSLNENESVLMQNAGWYPKEIKKIVTDSKGVTTVEIEKILVDKDGNFNVCIPLKMLSGFFEDYKKIIMNMKQELVLIRSSDDIDSVISSDQTEKPMIELNRLYWSIPHIKPSLSQQLRLTNISKSNKELPIKFRSWQMIQYPSLSSSKINTWVVKTSSKIETPRHVIIAFQKSRKGNLTKDFSKFDHCKLNNIRIFLNSERYPYNDLNLDFDNNKFATLYEMFANFQESYYDLHMNQPIYNPIEFKNNAPLVHIDCSRQKEVLQSGSIVLRIEFETDEPTTSETSAFCLILHEKEFTYNPTTKIVKQY